MPNTKPANSNSVTSPKKTLVDLPDPTPSMQTLNGSGRLDLKRYVGPLFLNEPSVTNIRQGDLEDCNFCAAVGGVAAMQPQAIRQAISDNKDGTYTARWHDGKKIHRETVDGDLYVQNRTPLYGSALTDRASPEKMELWFPLLEKAYAAWKGGFDNLDGGGSTGAVMSALTGFASKEIPASRGQKVLFSEIQKAAERKWPMTITTRKKGNHNLGAKLTRWHCYTVLGYKIVSGVPLIVLRNPWGDTGAGAGNKGIFELPLEEVVRYCNYLTVNQVQAV